MRRAVREALPALSYFYGIQPEQVEGMPYDELAEYLDQLPRFAELGRR